MKKYLLLISCAFFALTSFAGPVSRDKARLSAENFMAERGLSLKQTKQTFKAPRTNSAEEAYYYVFDSNDNKGYVIISGDDRTEPVLGYVDKGSFDEKNIPENMRSWLQFYVDRIKFMDEHNIQSSPLTESQKQARKAKKTHHAIAPILTCNWNQGYPYNLQCPMYYNEDGSIGEHSATGCVATAIAQVLYHHKHPAQTLKRIPAMAKKYSTPEGDKTVSLKAITAGEEIDWDSMCDNYYGGETEEQKQAVAKLMLIVGQSLKMGYGASSGSSYAESRKLFVDYLGYDDGVQILRSDKFGIEEWFEMMYDELDKGYPIGYGGSSTGGGHAFVVDGFDGEGLFHLNWGWGGGSNGYFRIDVLNPGDNSGIGASSSADGYSMGQDAIMYLRAGDDGVDAGYEPDTHMTINDTKITGTKIFSNYINWTGSTNSFNGAIVMADADGVFQPVSNINNADNLGANYLYGWTFDMAKRFSEPGVYHITPASKLKSAQKWVPLYDMKREYIIATVDDNLNVTLEHYNEPINLEITEWSFPGTLKANQQQDAVITLKNNGSEFKRELALYASQTDNMGNSVSRALIGVKEGDTDEFAFYFKPTANGTWNLWITLNSDRNTVIGHTTVDIGNNVKKAANLSVSSVSIQANGYGDFLRGTMSVHNNSTEDFKGFVNAQLWDNSPNDIYWYGGSSTRLYYEIPAGKTVSASFMFSNLTIGKNYRLKQTYVGQDGVLGDGDLFEGSQWTLNPGAVVWTKNATVSGASVPAAFTASQNAAGIRFYSATPTKVTPSGNTNVVYVFDEGTTVPESLNGYNVVVGKKAENISLTDEYTVAFPVTFTAEKASLAFHPTASCDGQTGWTAFTLPFKATSATVEGQEFSIADAAENGLLIKEFTEVTENGEVLFTEAKTLRGGTPYLVGVSEALAGKEIVFMGEDVEFKSTDTDNMLVSSEDYNFYGNTLSARIGSIYNINEAGDAFVLQTNKANQAPFKSYFVSKLAESPESIIIRFDSDATGIVNMNVTSHNTGIYDLQGRRVATPSKGLYIINGKTTIVK